MRYLIMKRDADSLEIRFIKNRILSNNNIGYDLYEN